MAYVVGLFIALFAVHVALAWGLIWARRETVLRHFAAPYVAASLPLFAFVGIETLGHHKPVQVAWWELNQKPKVLAYKAVTGQAIYLYVDIGEAEPRALVLPWSAEKAKKLAQAMDGDEGNGAYLEGDGNWLDGARVEYAPPQPPLPPKVQ